MPHPVPPSAIAGTGPNYVVHPDASFQLAYKGRWRFYFLEFERRATTPRRVRTRLGNYRRYSEAAGPTGTTAGRRPWCCSCSRTLMPREGFLHGVSGSHRPILFTSNSRPSTSVGYWATHGNCRRLTLPDGGRWRHWPW